MQCRAAMLLPWTHLQALSDEEKTQLLQCNLFFVSISDTELGNTETLPSHSLHVWHVMAYLYLLFTFLFHDTGSRNSRMLPCHQTTAMTKWLYGQGLVFIHSLRSLRTPGRCRSFPRTWRAQSCQPQTGNPVFFHELKENAPHNNMKNIFRLKKCEYIINTHLLMSSHVQFMYHSTCTGNTYVNPSCVIYHKVQNDCRSSSISYKINDPIKSHPQRPKGARISSILPRRHHQRHYWGYVV